MRRERLAFGGTHSPGISGVRATESKFAYRGPASRNTRFLVHGRRLFRDPSPEKGERRGQKEETKGKRRRKGKAGEKNTWVTTDY